MIAAWILPVPAWTVLVGLALALVVVVAGVQAWLDARARRRDPRYRSGR